MKLVKNKNCEVLVVHPFYGEGADGYPVVVRPRSDCLARNSRFSHSYFNGRRHIRYKSSFGDMVPWHGTRNKKVGPTRAHDLRHEKNELAHSSQNIKRFSPWALSAILNL